MLICKAFYSFNRSSLIFYRILVLLSWLLSKIIHYCGCFIGVDVPVDEKDLGSDSYKRVFVGLINRYNFEFKCDVDGLSWFEVGMDRRRWEGGCESLCVVFVAKMF